MSDNIRKKWVEKIRLKCRKCGHEWIIKKPKDFYFRYEKNSIFLLHRITQEKQYFKCPECKTNKIDRLPLVIIRSK